MILDRILHVSTHGSALKHPASCRPLPRRTASAGAGARCSAVNTVSAQQGSGKAFEDFKVACYSWAQYARGMEDTIKVFCFCDAGARCSAANTVPTQQDPARLSKLSKCKAGINPHAGAIP